MIISKEGQIAVSVIVPVYNVEQYLNKCLDSLVNQTLSNIEIIIVNDGTRDNSQEIINEYVEKYPRIVRSFIKKNGGLSDARNYGVPFSRGEFIGFVDSDDYIELDTYQKMYEEAVRSNSDLVMMDYIVEYPSKNERVTLRRCSEKKELFIDMKAAAWNKLYRREWLISTGVMFPKGLIYEDTEFFLKIIPHLRKFSFADGVSVHYVQRTGSIANTQGAKTGNIFTIFSNVYKYYNDQELIAEYQDELEYVTARTLLCSSFERIAKISDVNFRHELSRKTFLELKRMFPNWKKNRYLKHNSIHNIYMKSIFEGTTTIFVDILNKLVKFGVRNR